MKLLVLSRTPSLFSTRRLGLVGVARGHEVRVLDPLRCSLVLRGGGVEVFSGGAALGPVDAVIHRKGSTGVGHALAVARHFELAGAYCLNRSEPTARARDKMRTLQLLAARGIPIVPTALARSAADVRHAVERLGGTPCVVKLADGTHGKGVMLAESVTAAESIVGALVSVHRHLLLQEYIPYDHDLRLIVLGRKVIAAMRRRPRDGNFRANLHQGGVGEPHAPTATQTELALAAARALGLEFAGVDLLETPHGPLVLEINASPGLEGIEGASGCNVALAVIRLIEARVRAKAPVA